MRMDAESFPTVKEFVRDLAGYAVVEEVLFYYSHRLLRLRLSQLGLTLNA